MRAKPLSDQRLDQTTTSREICPQPIAEFGRIAREPLVFADRTQMMRKTVRRELSPPEWRRSDPQTLNPRRPMKLIEHMGHQDLWHTGTRGSRGRSGATMMNDDGNPLEERRMVYRPDDLHMTRQRHAPESGPTL